MKVMDFNNEEDKLINMNESYAEATQRPKRKVAKEKANEEQLTLNVFIKEMFSLVIYVACVFIVVFLIIHYVGQRTVVSGSSMEATLSDGDNLIVEKISYRFNDPERFDIIVFPYEYEPDTYYIKRIIGMPGETVYIDADGSIYINDSLLVENYGKDVILNPGLAYETIVLADDEYFVLGDNRNNSTDSRFESVGNIKRDEIVGKAWVRIFPFSKFGKVGHQ